MHKPASSVLRVEEEWNKKKKKEKKRKERNKEMESWEEGAKDPARGGEVTCTFSKNNCSQVQIVSTNYSADKLIGNYLEKFCSILTSSQYFGVAFHK